ncbi:PilZ domain-containing protein [Photobacterium kishitanii]|uniref:PilZ domain-containing protein n=1 Tax=Photobacterium kishitanii TaxID=318456 RepID=A0A2T3KN00_9GAMM|nr:PilZ domain-containing protein [Photobacterium kishitanii]PSV01179.1 hypothetical protein C9J27_03910 [Photobacterium kishitanii]
MNKNRKMPRVGCTYSCVVGNKKDNNEINAYLADISANGASFCPCLLTDSQQFEIGDDLFVSIDLSEVSNLNQVLQMETVVKWKRGTLIGFEITYIDESNFKKWWVLVYKTFFGKI